MREICKENCIKKPQKHHLWRKFGAQIKISMAKVRNLSYPHAELNFVSVPEEYSRIRKAYSDHELGHIDALLPWKELARVFREKGYRKKQKGPTNQFTLKGKLALMFLKNLYNGLSDRNLIERLNRDVFLQLFCGVYIPIDDPIKNYKIVSAIRCELGKYLNIAELQKVLFEVYKDSLDHPHIIHMDATVYESAIRYPTDAKILWEGCDWLYHELKKLSRALGYKNARTKYKNIRKAYLEYAKSKKKTYAKGLRIRRRLLRLLGKLLHLMLDTMAYTGIGLKDLPKRKKRRLEAIIQMREQQEQIFLNQPVSGRIVSLDKPYLRPIVRGKEVKRVEFGAKVHVIQIGGINFIEHLSFDAFNESPRLQSAIHLARTYSGKVSHLSADKIYPSNKNRAYCTENNITTSFVRKGKAGKYESQRSQMQALLSKERSTRLEGSFGVEKNHYGLSRVAARIEETEVLWIFFGVHAANLMRIARRSMVEQPIAKAG